MYNFLAFLLLPHHHFAFGADLAAESRVLFAGKHYSIVPWARYVKA